MKKKNNVMMIAVIAITLLMIGCVVVMGIIRNSNRNNPDVKPPEQTTDTTDKYGAFITGITQNVEDLLQSHTARTMLANSELVVMLNQAATDREELASLMGISDLQMSYITNVDAGHGLVKIGGALVPFVNKVPKDTKLYALMTTKFGES